jgi:hypothetical protein
MGAALGDSVFLLGGLDANGVSSGDVYLVQPSTGNVTLAGRLATPTHGGAAVTLGKRVLVFGGADVSPDDLVQAFDPATGTTSVIGHMPGPRADLVGAAVGNEVVLLAGFNGSAFLSVWTTPDGKSFSVMGQIARVERYPAIVVVGTKIYLFGGLVAGGEYNGMFSTTIQSFDVATRQGQVVGQLPTPLAHARAAVLDREVLVFGLRGPPPRSCVSTRPPAPSRRPGRSRDRWPTRRSERSATRCTWRAAWPLPLEGRCAPSCKSRR